MSLSSHNGKTNEDVKNTRMVKKHLAAHTVNTQHDLNIYKCNNLLKIIRFANINFTFNKKRFDYTE